MCGRFIQITDPEKITTILSDPEIDVAALHVSGRFENSIQEVEDV
ncbi:MAG: hypothetical protein ACLQDF_03785 [Desulfomonilia bacterium]|jgi:hypothetical protein